MDKTSEVRTILTLGPLKFPPQRINMEDGYYKGLQVKRSYR